MAKNLLLISIAVVAITIVAEAATTSPAQLSPATRKSIDDLNSSLQKVVDAVATATPLAEQSEARRAASAHVQSVKLALAKATKTGDEKKVTDLIFRFRIAAAVVNAAPPAKKLKVMEEGFNSAIAPSVMDCPAVDKSYCEMRSKVQKAFDDVMEATPLDKKLEVKEALIKKTMYTAITTVNKAYADGDEKKITKVLATYSKAADAVIAAAPAEKRKVMEETFAEATAGSMKH